MCMCVFVCARCCMMCVYDVRVCGCGCGCGCAWHAGRAGFVQGAHTGTLGNIPCLSCLPSLETMRHGKREEGHPSHHPLPVDPSLTPPPPSLHDPLPVLSLHLPPPLMHLLISPHTSTLLHIYLLVSTHPSPIIHPYTVCPPPSSSQVHCPHHADGQIHAPPRRL